MNNDVKFYDKGWFMWLTLIFFAPIGIFLMWRNNKFSKIARGILSGVFGVWFLIIAIGSSGNNEVPQNDKASLSLQQTVSEKSTEETKLAGDTTKQDEPKKVEESTKSEDTKTNETAAVSGQLKVHFIDVGQADSILVQQGSNYMLVDAGNNEDAQTLKSYLSQQGINELQYFVGTHKDEDHIGSADYIINSFKVGKVYFPKQTATTKTFQDFVTAVQGKGLKLTPPSVGESFKLGEATITVLAPNSASYEDANDYSIVLKVVYGSTSFLLTGDAESVSESEMVSKGLDLSSTVLKVGHHGSKTSTSQAFLDKVNPKYAVISVGKGNSYGHPTQEVMNRLQAKGIPVYRTDENGTVVATSDGTNITFNTNPGSYKGITSSATSSSTNTTSNTTSSSQTTQTPATTSSSTTKVYWLNTGTSKSYHKDPNCRYIKGKTVSSGSIQDAINAKHDDPCDICAK